MGEVLISGSLIFCVFNNIHSKYALMTKELHNYIMKNLSEKVQIKNKFLKARPKL